MKLTVIKIIIRDLHFRDEEAFHQYATSPNVGPMAGWKPSPNYEVSKRLLASNILSKEVYAIALKESNLFIGCISIYNYGIRKYNKVKSLGFSLNESYWGNGIMTEAVKLVINYIFDKTDYDGRLCKYKRLYDGRLVDADFYSMTREDYERKKKYE